MLTMANKMFSQISENSLTGDTFDDTSEIPRVYRQRQKKCGRFGSTMACLKNNILLNLLALFAFPNEKKIVFI